MATATSIISAEDVPIARHHHLASLHSWQMYWPQYCRTHSNVELGRTIKTNSSVPRLKRRKTQQSSYKPFDRCCIEIVERVLSFVPLEQRLALKAVCRSFNEILSSPHMYPCIHLVALPVPPQGLLDVIPTLLPGTRSLSLRSFSRAQLKPILNAIQPAKLASLDLSFSVITDEALSDLHESGALEQVRHLHLKGCRGVRDGAWLSTILPRVETLDLSWSGLDRLPSPSDAVVMSKDANDSSQVVSNPDDSGFFELVDVVDAKVPWPRLRWLAISSLPYLSRTTLLDFMSALPRAIEYLDLSHSGLTTRDIALVSSGLIECPALETVDVSGNDGLTLACIGQLRQASKQSKGLCIIHTAMLESEAEEHVRRFVQMVAGVISRS